MSQSPLQRSTRRSLPAFAHPPSRLSKATSSHDLSPSTSRRQSRLIDTEEVTDEDVDEEPERPVATTSRPTSIARPRPSNPSFATPPPAPRLKYDEEPHQRRTPIYYSPQAASTPPAGLSKSASIPFDMAASAKAARTAKPPSGTQDQGVDAGSGGGPSGKGKKARYIRKKSTFQR